MAMISLLPDELWRIILELGVERCGFSYKDLCCLSMTSKRLRRLSGESSFWSSLLSTDFPDRPNTSTTYSSSSISFATSSSYSGDVSNNFSRPSSPKTVYQLRYEKDKARRAAAHRRAVLMVESRVSEHSRRMQQLLSQKNQEVHKIKEAVSELSSLHKTCFNFFERQASVAMNVWQPEIVRGRQKQMVEQCCVPVESRINAVQMEMKLCNQQMAMLDKAYRDEKKRLATAKEQLASLHYHPLHNFSDSSSRFTDSHYKRKKLKIHSTIEGDVKGKSPKHN